MQALVKFELDVGWNARKRIRWPDSAWVHNTAFSVLCYILLCPSP